MNIDTWNREAMDLSGPVPPPFVAGPLPRASLAPKGAQHTAGGSSEGSSSGAGESGEGSSEGRSSLSRGASLAP